MGSRGVLKTGEAYCLECNESVTRMDERCPSCDTQFEREVRAFACPRCRTVMAFGSPQCPKCNMKFRVKSVSSKPSPEDERLLVKLVEWGKPKADDEGAEPAPEPQPPTPAEAAKLGQLRSSIEDLVSNRSEMLRRMEKRLEDEKSRLERISSLEGRSPTTEQIEAEVMALADEMADMTMLQAHMEAVSDEISTIIESFNLGDAARERGLAAKALRMRLDEKERELANLKQKEEQLVTREEMVDKKIKGYAEKKKELDSLEEELRKRMQSLEAEKLELDRIRLDLAAASSAAEKRAAGAEWEEEKRRLKHRLIDLQSTVSINGASQKRPQAELAAAEQDIGAMISELETRTKELLLQRADLERRMADAQMIDEDLRRLLKVLDGLLEKLPEEVIQGFSKSDDFALYERVLDKMKI